LPGERRWLALVADLMMAERECCPFLTFQLTAEPKMGPLTLRITGPDGAKELLNSILPVLAMPEAKVPDGSRAG